MQVRKNDFTVEIKGKYMKNSTNCNLFHLLCIFREVVNGRINGHASIMCNVMWVRTLKRRLISHVPIVYDVIWVRTLKRRLILENELKMQMIIRMVNLCCFKCLY